MKFFNTLSIIAIAIQSIYAEKTLEEMIRETDEYKDERIKVTSYQNVAILKMPNGTTRGCVSETVVPMLIGEEPYSYAKCAFISNNCPFPKDVTALAKKDKIPSGICNGVWYGDIGKIDCFGDDGKRYCIKDSSYVQAEPTKSDEFRKSGDGRFCSYASFKGEEYGSNVIDCSLYGIDSKEKIELVNNFIRDNKFIVDNQTGCEFQIKNPSSNKQNFKDAGKRFNDKLRANQDSNLIQCDTI